MGNRHVYTYITILSGEKSTYILNDETNMRYRYHIVV